MNKAELAQALYEECPEDVSSKASAVRIIEGLFDVIKDEMQGGVTEVAIPGFGKFGRKKRAARNGRNPHTGESIKIKAKFVPTFKASAPLKEHVSKARK